MLLMQVRFCNGFLSTSALGGGGTSRTVARSSAVSRLLLGIKLHLQSTKTLSRVQQANDGAWLHVRIKVEAIDGGTLRMELYVGTFAGT